MGGRIDTDFNMPRCTEDLGACEITGFWALTSVPEPSTYTVLASALVGVFLLIQIETLED